MLVDDLKPGTIACGSSLVIHQYELDKVTACDGFGGAGDGDNRVVQEARRKLQQAMDKITCEAGCSKTKTETFRGWKCGPLNAGGPLVAEAVVQWTAVCEKP